MWSWEIIIKVRKNKLVASDISLSFFQASINMFDISNYFEHSTNCWITQTWSINSAPWTVSRAPISNSHLKWEPKSDCWFMLIHGKTLFGAFGRKRISRTPASTSYITLHCGNDTTQRNFFGDMWVRHSILYLDNVNDIKYRRMSDIEKLIYIYMLSVVCCNKFELFRAYLRIEIRVFHWISEDAYALHTCWNLLIWKASTK